MAINSDHTDYVFFNENQLKSLYTVGAISTILVLVGIVTDIIVGSISGGNLTELPQTAVDRFYQLQHNKWLGLYNLDFLNTLIQLISVPIYLALFLAHFRVSFTSALLGLIVFLIGSIIFIALNSALPMLELSNKYALSTSEEQKKIYAAAGEAMLARGAHGSLGVFFSFLLPSIGSFIISLAMLKGNIFSKTSAWLGILGNSLLVVYIVLVTSAPGIKEIATLVAMPGGIMLLIWMVLVAIKFTKLGKLNIKKFGYENQANQCIG